MDNQLTHYGVLGMTWGVRKARPEKLSANSKTSSVTKKVINDYNTLDDKQFRQKYKTTKDVYAKRVAKYGDPYKNSPLVKTAKTMNKVSKSMKEPLKAAAYTASVFMAVHGAKTLADIASSQIKSGKNVSWQVLDAVGNEVYTHYTRK